MTNKQRAEYKTWDKARLITEINRLMRENEKARADERAKIRAEFKIYNRLEAKFTLNQCSEKDGLYCLDVTELFYGLVDRVLWETNNNLKEQK